MEVIIFSATTTMKKVLGGDSTLHAGGVRWSQKFRPCAPQFLGSTLCL